MPARLMRVSFPCELVGVGVGGDVLPGVPLRGGHDGVRVAAEEQSGVWLVGVDGGEQSDVGS